MLLKRPMGSTSSNVNDIILKVTLGIHCTYYIRVVELNWHPERIRWSSQSILGYLPVWVTLLTWLTQMTDIHVFCFCLGFSVRFLSLLRGHSDISYSPQRPMTSDFEGFSIPDFSHYIYFEKFLRKSLRYFPFLTLSAKQGHYWYHFYNIFGMTRSLTGDWTRDLPPSKPALYHKAIEEAVLDWGLNPGPPALEASTLPLGYRGGGENIHWCIILIVTIILTL